jgi:hypothetical protein
METKYIIVHEGDTFHGIAIDKNLKESWVEIGFCKKTSKVFLEEDKNFKLEAKVPFKILLTEKEGKPKRESTWCVVDKLKIIKNGKHK